MTFFEAIELARKTGKKVKTDNAYVAGWIGGFFLWVPTGEAVRIDDWVMNAEWSVAHEVATTTPMMTA